jgi:uncharacterized protein (DUF433 family)
MPTTRRSQYYPNIIHDPTIQGGAAVVAGTRLPVRALALDWRETRDRKRILRNYPQLTPELLAEARVCPLRKNRPAGLGCIRSTSHSAMTRRMR